MLKYGDRDGGPFSSTCLDAAGYLVTSEPEVSHIKVNRMLEEDRERHAARLSPVKEKPTTSRQRQKTKMTMCMNAALTHSNHLESHFL